MVVVVKACAIKNRPNLYIAMLAMTWLFLAAAIHIAGAMIGVVDSICSGSAIIYNH